MKRFFEILIIFIVVLTMIICELISPSKAFDNDYFFYPDDEF